MRHVVMFSGGAGSWAAAKRVADKHGTSDLTLLFTDTLTEDEDLYRFLIESAANFTGASVTDLLKRCAEIPPIEDDEQANKTFLIDLADRTNQALPILRWTHDGRNIWDVFKDERYIANPVADNCSRTLKRRKSRAWLKEHFDPTDALIYLGIDWSEIHRYERAIAPWHPWTIKAPMTEEPYVDKLDVIDQLLAIGIAPPRLYGENFPHNNCGGACVKAGVGQWLHLLKTRPKRYRFHERKEQEIRAYLDKDVSILKLRQTGGDYRPMTLRELRVWQEDQDRLKPLAVAGNVGANLELMVKETKRRNPNQITVLDLDDWGGCGCFTGEEGAE